MSLSNRILLAFAVLGLYAPAVATIVLGTRPAAAAEISTHDYTCADVQFVAHTFGMSAADIAKAGRERGYTEAQIRWAMECLKGPAAGKPTPAVKRLVRSHRKHHKGRVGSVLAALAPGLLAEQTLPTQTIAVAFTESLPDHATVHHPVARPAPKTEAPPPPPQEAAPEKKSMTKFNLILVAAAALFAWTVGRFGVVKLAELVKAKWGAGVKDLSALETRVSDMEAQLKGFFAVHGVTATVTALPAGPVGPASTPGPTYAV